MIFFKLLLGFATIAIIVYNIVKGFTPQEGTAHQKKYKDTEVVLSNETNTSITFAWQSQESEIGSVEYGIIPNTYYQSASELSPTNIHEVHLTSLKPCTKYYYQVTSESMLFDVDRGHFTTLCKNDSISDKQSPNQKNNNE